MRTVEFICKALENVQFGRQRMSGAVALSVKHNAVKKYYDTISSQSRWETM